MKETWRWFGPDDPVTLEQVKQAGATGIVTALHHIYRGETWPLAEVLKRKAEIEAAGLEWSVVESIPVHNSIKLRSGPYQQHIEAWKDSLAAIAKAGVKVVCYNFMPVVDWTRTDLRWQLPSTGYALRFDMIDFAVYDAFILKRKDAEQDYTPAQIASARARFEAMPEARRQNLEATIIAGLPGAEGWYTRETIRALLAQYEGIKPSELRANLIAFLREVASVAEELGIIGDHRVQYFFADIRGRGMIHVDDAFLSHALHRIPEYVAGRLNILSLKFRKCHSGNREVLSPAGTNSQL